MPLAASDWIGAVTMSLGAQLAGGPAPDSQTAEMMAGLTVLVPLFWQMEADRPTVKLQYLFTTRRSIECLQGQLRSKTDGMLGRSLRLYYSQKFKNLESMAKCVQEDIATEEKRLAARMPPAVGRLVTVRPRMEGLVSAHPCVLNVDGANVVVTPVYAPVRHLDPADPALGGLPDRSPVSVVEGQETR